MKIDIDDALLARRQELLIKISLARKEEDQIGNQVEHGRWKEVEDIERKIINITMLAYYKRDDVEERENG